MIPNIIAVFFISIAFGFIFLWAGISGNLMIEVLVEGGVVRDFTILGVVFGGVVGTLGLWLKARGKRHGQG